VQEAFVQLARARSQKGAEPVAFGYLATTVRNTCYSMLRRRRRRAEVVEPLLERASPEATEEERVMVEEALNALPVEQREVVYLKMFEGLTFREISDRCGISINTAGSRYRYATETLRRVLGPGKETC